MKYMIQVRFDGADAAIQGLPRDEQNKITAEFQTIRTLSGVLDGNQLESASTAKPSESVTVRRSSATGPPSITGPRSTATTSSTPRISTQRSRSRHRSQWPGWAAPSRCAR
jgi:hypothetical protein